MADTHPDLPNWSEILEHGEWSDATAALASQWPTCAIAEAHARYPDVVTVGEKGRPNNRTLERLGVEFADALDAGDVDKAHDFYDAIQRHVTLLLDLRAEEERA